EKGVDEIAGVGGRRLLGGPEPPCEGQDDQGQERGGALAHFSSITSPGSSRSNAFAGRASLILTFSNRMVVWSPVGSVRRVCSGIERSVSTQRRIPENSPDWPAF